MTPERELFAEALHDMLERSYTPDRMDKLAGMGVFELDPATAVVAFEELGHHAVPGPVVETVVAASLLALDGRSATIGTAYALDADEADLVLALDGNELWLATPGRRIESVDETRRLFSLERAELLRDDVDTPAALDLGALLCAAQLLGLARGMVEMAVEHAKTRVQFGRPIGGFQAVKHRLADAHIAVTFARPLLHAAAESLAPRDISAAKVKCADAAQIAARAALQVHGAIGFTLEYRLSRWLNKTAALIPAWGTRSEHRARIMESLIESRMESL